MDGANALQRLISAAAVRDFLNQACIAVASNGVP